MAIKFLNDLDVHGNIDLKNNQSLNMVVQHLATNPGTVVEGKIFYNSTTHVMMVGLNTGTASSVVLEWVALSSATGDITGIVAGTGLTGSSLTGGDATLNVIGGAGITANADEILLTNGLIADGSNITSVGTLGALQVDNININGNTITSSTAADLVINVTNGQSVVIEGVDIDDGVVTGATLVTPALGTPASGVMTNVTGTASGLTAGNVSTNANLSGHITSVGNAAVLGSFTSAQLKAALTNETGSGVAVFATSPTLVTPALGTPTSGVMTNVTGTASSLNIGGNAATSTKIASITNTDIVQLGESQTLTNKTIAISQVTELSGLTEAEGTQLEAIGTTTISANQWGYLGALTTDVQTELDKLQTLTTAEVDQLENINSVTITNAQWGYLGAATGAITNTNTETTTVLSLPGGNVLRYVDEAGNTTNLDISSYLDDTNLARLTSGSLNGSNGVATFTRDDSSTFTIDMSDFLDAITLNNTLTSTSTTQGLTANQGKVLKGLIDALVTSTGTNTGDEPDASATVKGIIEIATADETLVGTDVARAVTPDTLAAKSVTATIAQSSITDTKTVTITHNLGTADVIVQLFDMTTEANIYADIYRTAADMSTASTSVITVDFGAVTPPNDIRCLITSIKGATAAPTIAYT